MAWLQYAWFLKYLLIYFFFLIPNIRIKNFLLTNGLPTYYKVREKKTGNFISSTISVRRSAKRIKHQGKVLYEDPVKRDDSKHSVKIDENAPKSQNNDSGFEEAKNCPNFDSFETEQFLAEIIKVR